MIKRFESFNNTEDIQTIEDIFQEFVDEYDVKMKIEDISKSKFQPNNYRVTFNFNKNLDDKEGKMILLLIGLKDKCLNMTEKPI